MAIYETSKRSTLLVRMASFLLLGSKQRGGNASNHNDQHSRNGDSFDSWPATAAVGVGFAVFLYLTGTYSNLSKDPNQDERSSHAEQELSLTNSLRFQNGDTVATIFGVCRSIVYNLAESLKALSKGGSEEAFLMQTRLRALENARAGQTVPKPDDMTIVFHSGTCQCNAVRFQVSVTTGGDMIPILPIP